jgi:hypothetical protein
VRGTKSLTLAQGFQKQVLQQVIGKGTVANAPTQPAPQFRGVGGPSISETGHGATIYKKMTCSPYFY